MPDGNTTPGAAGVSSSTGPDRFDTGDMAALDPRIFFMLLNRIEQLARDLGRAEGRRSILEEQLARLEEQVARLERR